MEQSKLKLVYIFIGLLVIGLLLMASFYNKIVINELILNIGIYLAGLAIVLIVICYFLDINFFEDLFLKRGIRSLLELLTYTNILWFLLIITIMIDQFIIGDDTFDKSILGFVSIYIAFLSIVVNFILGILSFANDFRTPILFIKKSLSLFDCFWILFFGLLVASFVWLIYFLLSVGFPTSAIIITLFIIIQINLLSAKLYRSSFDN